MPFVVDDGYLVELADLDGDGDLDLLQGSASAAEKLLENLGGRVFTNRNVTLPTEPVNAQACGDVNGDGRIDFVLGRWSRTLPSVVALNNGNWSFNVNPLPPVVGEPHAPRSPTSTATTISISSWSAAPAPRC